MRMTKLKEKIGQTEVLLKTVWKQKNVTAVTLLFYPLTSPGLSFPVTGRIE